MYLQQDQHADRGQGDPPRPKVLSVAIVLCEDGIKQQPDPQRRGARGLDDLETHG